MTRRSPSVREVNRDMPLFKQMTIAGVGLIGGSLALVAKRDGLVNRVVGFGRTQANLDIAKARGMIDLASRDPEQAALGSDLVMLAVPILTMRATLEKMLAHLAPDAVVTDVGSVKGWVVRELEPLIRPPVTLVAAHPVAGKEITGAGAALRATGGRTEQPGLADSRLTRDEQQSASARGRIGQPPLNEAKLAVPADQHRGLQHVASRHRTPPWGP